MPTDRTTKTLWCATCLTTADSIAIKTSNFAVDRGGSKTLVRCKTLNSGLNSGFGKLALFCGGATAKKSWTGCDSRVTQDKRTHILVARPQMLCVRCSASQPASWGSLQRWRSPRRPLAELGNWFAAGRKGEESPKGEAEGEKEQEGECFETDQLCHPCNLYTPGYIRHCSRIMLFPDKNFELSGQLPIEVRYCV